MTWELHYVQFCFKNKFVGMAFAYKKQNIMYSLFRRKFISQTTFSQMWEAGCTRAQKEMAKFSCCCYHLSLAIADVPVISFSCNRHISSSPGLVIVKKNTRRNNKNGAKRNKDGGLALIVSIIMPLK